jgi:hypothetical protein
MIGTQVKFKVGKDTSTPDILAGAILDVILVENNTRYLVVTNPAKAILTIDPASITEVIGLSFNVQGIQPLR